MLLADRLPAPLARLLLRAAFRAARLWWRVRRPDQVGALVAVHHGDEVLVLRQSYQPLWTFPGGGVRRDEEAAAAAARELREEVGLVVSPAALGAAPAVTHEYLARRDTVRFFALHRTDRPSVRLDEREIVEARWLTPDAALRLALVPHVRDYLRALAVRAPGGT